MEVLTLSHQWKSGLIRSELMASFGKLTRGCPHPNKCTHPNAALLEAREMCNPHLPSYMAGVMEKLKLCPASNLHGYSVACWHDFVLCRLACSVIRSESDLGSGVIKDHSQKGSVNKTQLGSLHPHLPPSTVLPNRASSFLSLSILVYQTQIV